MWLLPKECLCLPASEQQRGKLPTLALAGLLGQERVEAKRQVAQLVPLLWSYQTPSGALILGVWRSGSSPSLLQVIRQLFIRFSDARIMYETESPSTQVLSFGLGDSLLAIGAAFVMESLSEAPLLWARFSRGGRIIRRAWVESRASTEPKRVGLSATFANVRGLTTSRRRTLSALRILCMTEICELSRALASTRFGPRA